MTITLTDRAVVAARAAVEDEEPVPLGIRVGVVGGGCSGYSYAMDFVDDGNDEEDMVLQLEGIDVYIDPHSAQMLADTEIDYIDTLQRRGFVFNNPNASTTCGCGSSFS